MKKKKIISISLDPELINQIRLYAKDCHRTISAVITLAMEKYLDSEFSRDLEDK